MSGRISLRASVFVLALLCVVAAQAVSFAILLAFPSNAPPPVVPADVERAVRAPASATAAGLSVRDNGDQAPFAQDAKPYARLVAKILEASLAEAGISEVRVHSLSDAVSIETNGAPPLSVTGARGGNMGATSDPSTAPFPSFATAVRRVDGGWTLVEPNSPPPPPGYLRIALAFALSALLLAPLAWWTSRRITRPLQLLADASRALGSDPGAAPLPVAGPPEVRDASTAFNAMQASLGRHMDERATLMAAIAHDLRTPLTSLRIRAEAAPEPQRVRMSADIARMEALIADLLMFVRGARAAADRDRLDLMEAAREVVEALPPDAPASLDGRRAVVIANRQAVRRVLENLVGNAIDHGGNARVSVTTADGQARVDVADDGPGVPEESLERVFEPFVRLETSRSRETGGVGLGLAIARSIARAHGGEVQLIRREAGGTLARLTLPLANAGS